MFLVFSPNRISQRRPWKSMPSGNAGAIVEATTGHLTVRKINQRSLSPPLIARPYSVPIADWHEIFTLPTRIDRKSVISSRTPLSQPSGAVLVASHSQAGVMLMGLMPAEHRQGLARTDWGEREAGIAEPHAQPDQSAVRPPGDALAGAAIANGWKMRRSSLSPSYTTDWKALLIVS